MAGLRFTFPFAITTATSTLTAIVITAPTNQKIRIERIVITGKGTTAGDTPVQFELLTFAGSGTGSTESPVKANASDGETVQATAKTTLTVEPSTPTLIKQKFAVHPQSSRDMVYPPGRDMYIKGGEIIGLRLVSPTQASTFIGQIECEE